MTGAWLLLAAAALVVPALPHRRRGTCSAAASAVGARSTALVLDLAAAALRSGKPLADALALAAPAGGPEEGRALEHVARLCELGADPAQAWSGMPQNGPLAEAGRVAVRSASSGVRLAAGFERLAADLRAQRVAEATARAHRSGVVTLAPLAACFLPSFVCLGIVPVLVGVARNALGGVLR